VLLRSATHRAAALALQVVNPSTEHRSLQATLAWTEQVALHEALQLPSQEESADAAHFVVHVEWHWPLQVSLHCVGSIEPAQSVLQLSPHMSKQLTSQSLFEPAFHPIAQSAPQSSRQVPVASALH
jgi:hypothetical protein